MIWWKEVIELDKKNETLRIDFNKLLDILKAVYTLTDIKISLYDTENRMLLSYPKEQSCFCRMVREYELEQCLRNDADGFAWCKKQGRLISYCCHAGLKEVIVPVMQNQTVVAYIMFGQMLMERDLERQKDRLIRNYSWLAKEEQIIKDAVDRLTACGEEKIRAATMLVEICISYLLSQRIVFLEEKRFMERLDTFIDNHLEEELNPDMICSYFGMHRTSLYQAVRQVTGCGIMAYIRKRRLDEAKRLLKEGGMTVTRIAGQVGFRDYNYFLRVFKQETGVSCRDYRKREQSSCTKLQ